MLAAAPGDACKGVSAKSDSKARTGPCRRRAERARMAGGENAISGADGSDAGGDTRAGCVRGQRADDNASGTPRADGAGLAQAASEHGRAVRGAAASEQRPEATVAATTEQRDEAAAGGAQETHKGAANDKARLARLACGCCKHAGHVEKTCPRLRGKAREGEPVAPRAQASCSTQASDVDRDVVGSRLLDSASRTLPNAIASSTQASSLQTVADGGLSVGDSAQASPRVREGQGDEGDETRSLLPDTASDLPYEGGETAKDLPDSVRVESDAMNMEDAGKAAKVQQGPDGAEDGAEDGAARAGQQQGRGAVSKGQAERAQDAARTSNSPPGREDKTQDGSSPQQGCTRPPCAVQADKTQQGHSNGSQAAASTAVSPQAPQSSSTQRMSMPAPPAATDTDPPLVVRKTRGKPFARKKR